MGTSGALNAYQLVNSPTYVLFLVCSMKLSMFVTVDGEGNTFVLAYMVHYSEDFEDVWWGFKAFDLVFRHPPGVIMTDSAGGIMNNLTRRVAWMFPKVHG